MRKLYLLLLFAFFLSKVNGQAGSPDYTFGSSGIQLTAFSNNTNPLSEEGRVVLIDTNGDIFVVARLVPNGSYTRIVKYLPGGQMDSSYGNGGYSTTAILSATGAVMQGGNIIVTGGISNSGIPDNIGFARYTPGGALDTSFGENGIVRTGFYSYQANAIVLQGDKIIVGGYGDNLQFFLARFTANGSLDSSFGNKGNIATDFNSSSSFVNAIILQGDKIIAAGGAFNAVTFNYDFALARYTTDGSLDSSFGENGKVTSAFSNSDDQATSLALQGDKILVGGFGDVTVDFVLARYTADGILDPSFGDNGKVTTNFNNSFYNYAYSLVLQGDKILLAGETLGDFALARYTADGALDLTFGKNGIVITDFNTNQDHAYSMALQGDKIIVVGSTFYYSIDGFPADFAVIRYAADGSPDSSFGENGVIAGHFPRTQVYFTSTAIQGNNIIAAGYTGVSYSINAFALARFTANGALDPSFGVNGRAVTNFDSSDQRANSIVLQGDKIIVGGYRGFFQFSDFMLARYTAAGKLDSSFGVNGRVITDFNNSYDQVSTIALQGDKILVTGSVYSQNNLSDFVLARYTADGRLDSTFGVNGKVTTDFFQSYDFANLLALQGDKIIVAGYVGEGVGDFALARYTADGLLDATFGANGKVTTDINNSSNDKATSIALEGDKIILAGSSVDLFNTNAFVLVRYTADGMLDGSFGENGKVTTDFVSSYGHGNPLAVQNDKIILGGQVGNSDFSFSRYTADGRLDSSFGQNGKVSTNLTAAASLGEIALHQNRLYAVGSLTFGPDESYGLVAAYKLEENVVLSCHKDKTLATEQGVCTAVVNDIDPVFTPAENNAPVIYTLQGATTGNGTGSASGIAFNKGVTTVTYSLTNDAGKSCSFTVTVQDKEAPVISRAFASPLLLWPPDHEMKMVNINYSLYDNCGATTSLSVTSSEPQSGTGPHDLSPDWEVLDAHHVRLRAESSGIGYGWFFPYFGRIYTIHIKAVDDAGNRTTKKVSVLVPPRWLYNYVNKKEAADGLQVSVMPNPSNSSFTLLLKDKIDKSFNLRVSNELGRVVETRTGIAAHVTLKIGEKYPTGIYYAEIMQGYRRVVVKLVKLSK